MNTPIHIVRNTKGIKNTYCLPNGECDLISRERSRVAQFAILTTLMIPFMEGLPGVSFLLLIPVIAIMVFRPKYEYIIPLIIILACGSQQRFVVGACVTLYCLLNIGKLLRVRLLGIFLLHLSSLPFFVWLTYVRLGVMSHSFGQFGGGFASLGTFFSLSFFFWAAIAFKELPNCVFDGIYWILSLFLLSQYSTFMFGTERIGLYYMHFGTAFVLSYPVWAFLVHRRIGKIKILVSVLFLLLYMIAFVFGIGTEKAHTSFTPLFIFCLTCLIAFVAQRFRFLLKFFHPFIVFPLMFLNVWNSADLVEKYRGNTGETYEDHLGNVSVSGIIGRLKSKAVDDRATVWMLAKKGIINQWSKDPIWMPPVREMQMDVIYDDRLGRDREVQSNLPAHNLILQMLQDYGAWGGVTILIVFVLILSNRHCFSDIKIQIYNHYGHIMATCIAFNVFSSYSCATPINVTAAGLAMSLLGICYRRNFEQRF